MNENFSHLSESNPFSTCFTAPGKAPFFFESNLLEWIKSSHPAKFEEFFNNSIGTGEELRFSVCTRYLVDKFEKHSCRGQIVGNHGSGKTALLYVLKEALVRQGYEIFSWSLHDQSRFLPDVFWLELQRFLQAAPVLLPTKYLLPPPVMSREEYLAQQRDFLREVFPDEFLAPTGQENDVATPEEEFRVSETNSVSTDDGEDKAESSSEDANVSGPFSDSEQKSDARPSRIFGFNAAGNFGLKSDRLEDSDEITFRKTDSPVKFAPFPELPIVGENADSSQEEFDDVELAPEEHLTADSSDSFSDVEQKTLEIPLAYGAEEKRSFFDRKVLVFDGFEQLSFANRIIIRTFCRMNRLGLLLTTHSPMIGVPVPFRTIPTVDPIHQLLEYLLEDYDFKISDSEVEILLKNFNYDVREMLFSLYDAFESYRLAPQNLREKIVRRYPR